MTELKTTTGTRTCGLCQVVTHRWSNDIRAWLRSAEHDDSSCVRAHELRGRKDAA